MEKYKNIEEYLQKDNMCTREDLKDVMLRSALDLLSECAHNFGGDAEITERVSQPLFVLNDILDKVE